MGTIKLPIETIEGTPVEFIVDLETGGFSAHVSGEWWKADSLKKLRDKVRAHLRQQPVAIPATLIDGVEDEKLSVTKITITGQHAGNGNWLYREEAERTAQQHRWGTLYRGLTGQEIGELFRLHKEAQAAAQRLRKHVERLELNVTKAYEKARKATDPASDAMTPAAEAKVLKHRTRQHPDMDALNEEIIGPVVGEGD